MTSEISAHTRMFRRDNPGNRVKVGVSSCLLGEKVRFDGGHKHNRFCTQTLGEYFEFEPMCPEMAIGMGTPRDPVRLIDMDGDVRMVGTRDHTKDYTDPMRQWAGRESSQLDHLSGFIFMQKSPTCGVFRTKVYQPNGYAGAHGPGLWADAVMKNNPCLPVEEMGRLSDPVLADNFLTRVFTYADWKHTLGEKPRAQDLVDFHTRHKLLIMAHEPDAVGELGRLVADMKEAGLEATMMAYLSRLMAAMQHIATRKRNSHVLQYLMRFMKEQMPEKHRRELETLIEQYNNRQVPLVVPMTLVKHYLSQLPEDHYLAAQAYMQPHPCDLGLRNAV